FPSRRHEKLGPKHPRIGGKLQRCDIRAADIQDQIRGRRRARLVTGDYRSKIRPLCGERSALDLPERQHRRIIGGSGNRLAVRKVPYLLLPASRELLLYGVL